MAPVRLQVTTPAWASRAKNSSSVARMRTSRPVGRVEQGEHDAAQWARSHERGCRYGGSITRNQRGHHVLLLLNHRPGIGEAFGPRLYLRYSLFAGSWNPQAAASWSRTVSP